MLTNKTIPIFLSLIILLPGCVFNNSQVTQEKETPTVINDLQVACANNAQSIEELKAENAKIKGELEKLTYLVDQRAAATNKTNVVEAQEAPPSLNVAPAPVVVTKEAKKPEELDIDEQYKLARKNHEQKKYAEAEKYYIAMIGSKSAWFDEKARFFLGQMYSDAGDPKKAIITFQEFVDKYPKSKNIANAVYAQAECFMSLDQKAEAQVFFKDVIQRFPRAREATLAKQRLKSL